MQGTLYVQYYIVVFTDVNRQSQKGDSTLRRMDMSPFYGDCPCEGPYSDITHSAWIKVTAQYSYLLNLSSPFDTVDHAIICAG